MQFQVPQYIDVEDKIVGPLTITQFLYIAGGFIIIFVSFFFLVPWVWIIFSCLVGSLAIAFAFVKYNGRSLVSLILAALRHYGTPRTYTRTAPRGAPSFGQGFLAELGLKLDAGVKAAGFRRAIHPEERFEILRRITGDREVAKRVDYR